MNFTPIPPSYTRIVKLTLLGSIVSNLLLVMGSAFIAGGLFHPIQHFNQKSVNCSCALLILAVISVALPTLLSSTSDVAVGADAELALSRWGRVEGGWVECVQGGWEREVIGAHAVTVLSPPVLVISG